MGKTTKTRAAKGTASKTSKPAEGSPYERPSGLPSPAGTRAASLRKAQEGKDKKDSKTTLVDNKRVPPLEASSELKEPPPPIVPTPQNNETEEVVNNPNPVDTKLPPKEREQGSSTTHTVNDVNEVSHNADAELVKEKTKNDSYLQASGNNVPLVTTPENDDELFERYQALGIIAEDAPDVEDNFINLVIEVPKGTHDPHAPCA